MESARDLSRKSCTCRFKLLTVSSTGLMQNCCETIMSTFGPPWATVLHCVSTQYDAVRGKLRGLILLFDQQLAARSEVN